MAEKYDGWALKIPESDGGFLYARFFHRKKADVIKQIDGIVGEGYRNWRRNRGKDYKIVKVKLTEVKDG